MELETGVPDNSGEVRRQSKKQRRRNRQKLLVNTLLQDFAKNTTIHGLRYTSEVGLTLVEKVFWVITFLLSLGLCLILIERVWHKWQYSPVIVSLNERMISVSEIPFPSVTICPQWKCKKEIYAYQKEFERFFPHSKIIYISNQDEEDKQQLEDAMLICDHSKRYLLDRNVSNETLVKHIRRISPRFDEVTILCYWRGNKVHRCDSMFKAVLTEEGLCFNFNGLSNEDMFKIESIQKGYLYLNTNNKTNNWNFNSGYSSQKDSAYPLRGQENGANPDLEITFIEEPGKNDEKCNSRYNGFKIYVQHPADMPQTSLYYYAVVPGQVTSMALKLSIINTSESLLNYRSEQRQCFFPEDRQLKYFKIYTTSNCHLECLSIYTYKKCGCIWFHMPHTNSHEICTSKKKDCVVKAKNELASRTLEFDMGETCNCLPSCASVQYNAEILKTNFDFKKDYIQLRKNYAEPNNIGILHKLNFSKVEIYFKEPRFVSMRRSELFGLTDFLANCGGLLGLFLGFSFLSLVEITYFCTLRLWRTLKMDIKMQRTEIKENMCKY